MGRGPLRTGLSEVGGTIGFVKYRSTNKSVYSAHHHVIWCPKYRRRVIGGRVELRLKQIIHEVVAKAGGLVIELEAMPDHVQPVPRAAVDDTRRRSIVEGEGRNIGAKPVQGSMSTASTR